MDDIEIFDREVYKDIEDAMSIYGMFEVVEIQFTREELEQLLEGKCIVTNHGEYPHLFSMKD